MNKFISIQKRNDNFKNNIENLFSIKKEKIKEIIILTAYFDLKTLAWIYQLSKNIKIKIFIDKYSSKIFSDDEINKKLITSPKNIQIFLVNYGKLFHSKLYYIKSDKKIKILIGSLNFTFNAFEKNEEILNEYIESIDKKSNYICNIEKYIEDLENKSEKITKKLENKYNNNDLRSLLLDGYIYYESKEQESFSFTLSLPSEMKQINTEIDPTLEASIVDSLTLERLILESHSLKKIKFPKRDKNQSRWKNYCIETCYGYWNPSFFNDDLTNILDERKEKREPYFKEIKKLLKSHPKELENAFMDVCKSIKKNLPKGIDWKYDNEDKARKAWKEWIKKLLQKFENKTFYNRLILGITKVSPPDVWSDSLSSKEFEDSFLDSLIYHWSKEYNKSTSNKIAKVISHNIKEINEHFDKHNIDDNEKLKRDIEKWLFEYIDDDNNIFEEWDYS